MLNYLKVYRHFVNLLVILLKALSMTISQCVRNLDNTLNELRVSFVEVNKRVEARRHASWYAQLDQNFRRAYAQKGGNYVESLTYAVVMNRLDKSS